MDSNNKFLDKPVSKTNRDEVFTNCNKIVPHTQQNWVKNIAKEEPEDVEMEDTQELEENKEMESDKENQEKEAQEVKEIRTQRRKAVLKELEV